LSINYICTIFRVQKKRCSSWDPDLLNFENFLLFVVTFGFKGYFVQNIFIWFCFFSQTSLLLYRYLLFPNSSWDARQIWTLNKHRIRNWRWHLDCISNIYSLNVYWYIITNRTHLKGGSLLKKNGCHQKWGCLWKTSSTTILSCIPFFFAKAKFLRECYSPLLYKILNTHHNTSNVPDWLF
jgi:hypothetical protein